MNTKNNKQTLNEITETLTQLHDKIADKPHNDPLRILVETLEDQVLILVENTEEA